MRVPVGAVVSWGLFRAARVRLGTARCSAGGSARVGGKRGACSREPAQLQIVDGGEEQGRLYFSYSIILLIYFLLSVQGGGHLATLIKAREPKH